MRGVNDLYRMCNFENQLTIFKRFYKRLKRNVQAYLRTVDYVRLRTKNLKYDGGLWMQDPDCKRSVLTVEPQCH